MPERQFILSCESTVDLPYAYVTGRGIPVLFYSYMIDGESFLDDMGPDPESIPVFYKKLEAGALPTTAQLNQAQYEAFLEPLLQKGDVLHIVFGTGMTSSFPNIQPIRICDIGCIIAAHSGPGPAAVFFLGDPRAPEK